MRWVGFEEATKVRWSDYVKVCWGCQEGTELVCPCSGLVLMALVAVWWEVPSGRVDCTMTRVFGMWVWAWAKGVGY